jgi:hypothetical protein
MNGGTKMRAALLQSHPLQTCFGYKAYINKTLLGRLIIHWLNTTLLWLKLPKHT